MQLHERLLELRQLQEGFDALEHRQDFGDDGTEGELLDLGHALLEGGFQLVHIGGDGRQFGIRRVQPQQPDGGVREEIDRDIEQAGDKTLHAQGRAGALLDESLHRLAMVLEALALLPQLDDPLYDLDDHPDPHVERLGVRDGRDLFDLADLDAAKDDGCPDIQPLDGAIKKQDIGDFFLEEFAAAEQQHPGDHKDDGADHKGANRGRVDLTAHTLSFLAPARPWEPGSSLTPRWWGRPRPAAGRRESSARGRYPAGWRDAPPPASS